MTKVFIIDDDVQIAELLSTAIEGFGLVTECFNSAHDFFEISVSDIDIIMLDLNMPDMDGIEVIRALAITGCKARVILISGHDVGVLHSAEQLAQAHALKIVASLTKPIRMSDLKKLILDLAVELPGEQQAMEGNHLLPEVNELSEALKNNDFILHYQPQIDVRTGKLIGVEALVRWQHKHRGLVYPDMFISLAEEHNLIGELTDIVIKNSISQVKQWLQSGHKIPVSVNISADNVKGLYLPEQLMDVINNNQLDPGYLTLEVTESALMGELVTSLDILTRLRMKGFKLSIDDFGTGYSSLSQLHRIPFTELKIDKSFTMSMCNDVESRAIVKTCIMLGHELNMKVVAEGVESQRELEELRSLGCDIAQGYHIARPMPEEQFMEWFKSSLG